MNTLLTIIALWIALNALLFTWLAFGRYVDWFDLFQHREARRHR